MCFGRLLHLQSHGQQRHVENSQKNSQKCSLRLWNCACAYNEMCFNLTYVCNWRILHDSSTIKNYFSGAAVMKSHPGQLKPFKSPRMWCFLIPAFAPLLLLHIPWHRVSEKSTWTQGTARPAAPGWNERMINTQGSGSFIFTSQIWNRECSISEHLT